MERSSPTDPPDEPVNRIAWAMEPEKSIAPGAATPAQENASSAKLKQAFEDLVALYAGDPDGDHKLLVLTLANRFFGGPESAFMFFNTLSKSAESSLLNSLFISGRARVLQLIARDLQWLLKA